MRRQTANIDPSRRMACTPESRVRANPPEAAPRPLVGNQQRLGVSPAYAGLGHAIPSRDQSDKILREMTQARERAASGDTQERQHFEKLRNRVCATHLRFAVVISKRYGPRCGRLDFEDLLQFAALGLMRACEDFDPARGAAFSTYAANWIRQYVSRGIANYARIIRAPVHLQVARARCSRAAAKVAATGHTANIDELARLTGLRPRTIARSLAQLGEVLSLDCPAFDGDRATMGESVPSPGPTPLEALLAKERAEYARASLAALPDREREVVQLRTGDAELSLEEIGATLAVERTGRVGLCRERVRQIEQQAVARLRLRADDDLRLDS
jgi:RNA polymerase sigma factor (sigma-70 family)